MHSAKDLDTLTDELLAMDWGSRFESFKARDLRRLNGFNTFGWRLGNRAFFRESTRFHFGERTTLDHAGTELLENAGTALRQTWQPKDIANHEKVLDVLREHAAGDDRDDTIAVLDELGRRFAAELAEPRMKIVSAEDLEAGRWPRIVEEITADTVLDNWIHGIVVHTVPAKAEQVQIWSPVQYEWEVVKAVTGLTRIVLATHVVVRGALGVLDEDHRVTSGPGITATSIGPRTA